MHKIRFVVLTALIIVCFLTGSVIPARANVIPAQPQCGGTNGANIDLGNKIWLPAINSVCTPQLRTNVTWYIGLGAGSLAANIPLELAFVDKFNKSQTEIYLIPQIVSNNYASSNLKDMMAAGYVPDIVGPVGTAGRMNFPGAFLDLTSYVSTYDFDLSGIDPHFTQILTENGKLTSLPFAIYPEFMYVNKDLFAAAGLPLPPQHVGDKYNLDGSLVDWTYDTMAAVAKKLTLDKNGHNATSASFDPANIVQYGWVPQWTDNTRAVATLFGAYEQFDNTGAAQFPASARSAIQFYYNAMWGPQPFAPNADTMNSSMMQGNPWNSGKVAMATTHMWYTCCIDPAAVPHWDTAIMPSYNGLITAKMHVDTFAIPTGSKHPVEAFKVLKYMLTTSSADLYAIYGGLPARISQQAAFLASLDAKFAPLQVNWQPALDMIPYMDIPSHEHIITDHFTAVWNVLTNLTIQLQTNSSLDMNTFFNDAISQLNAAYQGLP